MDAVHQREQHAVLDAAPFHAHNSLYLMLRKGAYQFVRYVLIEKHLQRWACS